MQLFPEWAPNIHPLIIHFPIALLLIAVVVDLGAILFRKSDWLYKTAISLYALGALGTAAAYLSGKQAADVVTFPSASYSVISKHADLALYTTVFFSIYALVRLLLFWKKWDTKTGVAGLLLLVAAGGYGLVQQTAEQGGMLVYRYGVGTQATEAKSDAASTTAEASEIIISDNGSWTWSGDAGAFKQFKLLQGEANDLGIQTSTDGKSLTIDVLSPEALLLTFGPQLTNIELIAKVNLDAFNGRFSLVHHVTNKDVYDFLTINGEQTILGRLESGKTRSFDTEKVATQGWITLKAVGSNGHYRGYINDKLIVHGHGTDLPAGITGFAFSGAGSIQIANLDVISLDEMPMMDMKKESMEHDNMSDKESAGQHSH